MKKFKLGQVVTTSRISNAMLDDSAFADHVIASISRFQKCDWGDMCAADKKSNDDAVKNGNDRIFAAYQHENADWKIWIVTEWDRSVTTILFPDEY